jgi:hypothetical protein
MEIVRSSSTEDDGPRVVLSASEFETLFGAVREVLDLLSSDDVHTRMGVSWDELVQLQTEMRAIVHQLPA